MPKKKRYYIFLCKDCDIDFVISFKKSPYCPCCGDNLYIDFKCNIWLDRPFNYKRPWTDLEDSILVDGIAQRHKYKDIGVEIDRTTKAVTRRASQLRKRGFLDD